MIHANISLHRTKHSISLTYLCERRQGLCLLNESMDRFCTWYSEYVVVPVLGISRLSSQNAFVMNTSSSAIILLLNSILGRISPSSQIFSMHLNMIRASKSAVMILKPVCSPSLSCTAPKTWNSKNIFD